MQELAEFLGYLDGWAQYVGGLKDYTPAQKETMLLSRETREGIKTSGIYIYNPRYLSLELMYTIIQTSFCLTPIIQCYPSLKWRKSCLQCQEQNSY